MIDFEGLPLPDDAPPPGACIRKETPEEGIVRLHLEPPHRPKLAVLDLPLLRDLDRALEEIRGQAGMVKGLVIAGREPLSFAAGADVDAIGSVEDPALAARLVGAGQELFQKLYLMGRTGGGRILTVAAVGGPVPGGACELSLACDRIVLADHKRTRIGLPEVKLGIFPGWGGTQRLPRRTGVPAALDLILAGKLLPARPALKRGVVDRLTKPESLWRIATEIAAGRMKVRRRERAGWKLWLVDKNPLAGAIITSQARKGVMAKTRGHYPAPLAALPLVVRAPRVKLPEGLRDELDAVRPLVVSRTTKNLVRLFHLSEGAKKLARPDGMHVAGFRRGAVIGAGVMGAGIASLMAQKGIDVRLRDLDRKQLDEALHAHRRSVEKKRKRRRLERHEADAAIDRLETTTERIGFGRCEMVVEAVAERLDVKRTVFGRLVDLMPADAIFATNTSSLSVDEIAADLPGPERVVGMHFFNPVPLMPLVEIVRGSRTSDETVARIARLAVDLGKTPVVVKDVAGFLVNRVLGPYLDEALRLLQAGADPDAMDAALVAFGMPMGPCELLDEVGLDIASHAGASLEAAYGDRMRASTFLKPLLDAGDLGKKTGKGIYVWEKEKGRPVKAGKNPALPHGDGSFVAGTKEIVDRLTLAMLNEAVRCLDERVVAGPGELDLATVFGTGFAPFRGGVLRYGEALGLGAVAERLRAIHRSPEVAKDTDHAARFEPAPLLERLAQTSKSFHDAD